MINIFITLGLLLLIQLYIVLYISDKITINKEHENYYNLNLFKKFMEILVIIVVIFYTCKIYLKNNLSENIITQIIIVIEIIVTLFWLYLNFIEQNIIDYDSNTIDNTNITNITNMSNISNISNISDYNLPTEPVKKHSKDLNDHTSVLLNNVNNNNNTYIANNNIVETDNTDDERIFSKYISKYESDFEFDNLYPNYKAKKTECKETTNPDLTEYDGYDINHKCYNCGCVKQNNSDVKECKKLMYGTMWGCDPKWKCNNCKSCQDCSNLSIGECGSTVGCKYKSGKCEKDTKDEEDEDDEDDDEDGDEDDEDDDEDAKKKEDEAALAGCKKCQCWNRNGTLKCQKRLPITGDIVDCDSVCETCVRCPNEEEDNCSNSNSNFKYVLSEDEINRNNIVINNVSEKDLNTIL